MAITRVWIEPGCIACGVSVDHCPAVFDIPDGADTAVVKDGVALVDHEEEIRAAADACPVHVIQFEES